MNEIYFQLFVSKSVGPSCSWLLTLTLWVWSSGDIMLHFKVLLSTYILNISSSPICPVSWSFLGLVFFFPKGWTVVFSHVNLNNFSNLSLSLVCPNSSQQYLLLEAVADSQGRTSYLSSVATAGIKLSMPSFTTHSGENLNRVLCSRHLYDHVTRKHTFVNSKGRFWTFHLVLWPG